MFPWIVVLLGVAHCGEQSTKSRDLIPDDYSSEDRIAFTSDRDGDFDIYVMSSDG